LQGYLKKTDFPLEVPGKNTSPTPETVSEGEAETIETITSAETRQFLFYPGQDQADLSEMWDKVTLSSRASGAFPVAFPPVGDASDINSPNFAALSDDYIANPDAPPGQRKLKKIEKLEEIAKDETHLKFQYTDGGVLEGLPIVKGIMLDKLLSQRDDRPATSDEPQLKDPRFKPFKSKWQAQNCQLNLNQEKRLYVYIQPAPANDLKSESRLTKGYFSMLQVGLSGLTLPKAEHDAIRLEEIRQRNEDAKRKKELLKQLNSLSGNLPKEKLAQLCMDVEDAIPYKHVELRRIDPSIIAAAYNSKASDVLKPVGDALQKYLPEYMEDAIKNKEVKKLLACDFLGAFGGFFIRECRDHDFHLGRISGQIWLLQNCYDLTTVDTSKIQSLVNLIKGKSKQFLKKDPNPSLLIETRQVGILENLVWRAVRILSAESGLFGDRSGKYRGSEEEGTQALLRAVLTRLIVKAGVILLLLTGIVIAALALVFLSLLK
jgi:hypothetical protein